MFNNPGGRRSKREHHPLSNPSTNYPRQGAIPEISKGGGVGEEGFQGQVLMENVCTLNLCKKMHFLLFVMRRISSIWEMKKYEPPPNDAPVH